MIREPYRLARYTGGITSVFYENDSFIIGTHHVDSLYKESNIYSLKPDISLREMFSDSILFTEDLIKIQMEGKPRYLRAGENKIRILDSAFHTLKTDSSMQFLSLWSFNSSIGFLLKNAEVLFIDGNAEIVAKISDRRIDKLFSPQHLNYMKSKWVEDEFPFIHFYNNRDLLSLSLSTNYVYKYIFLFSPAIFLFLYFGISGSFYVFIRFFLDYRTKQRLINSNANGIMLLDGNLRIKYLNDNFRETLILGHENHSGQYFNNVIDNDSPAFAFIRKGIGCDSMISDAISWVRHEKEFTGRIVMTPFRIFSDYVMGYLIELINYTEPVSAERVKAWSKTSQKIAHDIKTPLSTIQLSVSALHQRIENSEIEDKAECLDDLHYISKEARRISNLTRNFLQLSNLNKPIKKLITIEDLLNFSLQRFQSYFRNDIKLEMQIESPKEVLFCDPTQIGQVLEVLTENAIEALGKKGGRLRIICGRDGRMYLISIEDNGPGINARNLDKIFEPYFSTKSEGSGLGLIIAKNIIEEHSGSITAISRENEGTTFIILLPGMEKNE